MKHTYIITGMTCQGCQFKVQHLLSAVPGVNEVTVDLANGAAQIAMEGHVPINALREALKEYPKYGLSEAGDAAPMSLAEEPQPRSWLATYKPILLIFAYITATAFIAGYGASGIDWMRAMRIFMSGFFLVFSFFKLLDVRAFADSYAMYDVIARKFKGWGVIYAFVELALGLAFAANFQPVIANWAALVVMTVSIIGVLQSVLNKQQIKCACLGAVFNLPMSTVTIIEDALMIAMSAGMLWMLQ